MLVLDLDAFLDGGYFLISFLQHALEEIAFHFQIGEFCCWRCVAMTVAVAVAVAVTDACGEPRGQRFERAHDCSCRSRSDGGGSRCGAGVHAAPGHSFCW